MQVAYNGTAPSVAPMGMVADQMFAPQGFIGGALGSALGGLGGGALGRALGNQNLGRQIGSVAGGVLGGLLPFDAGPQAYAGTYYVPQTAAPGFAPQGIVGDALGAIGAPLGGFIGGRFGNAGLGQTIGGTVGGLAQRFLPFDAGPQAYAGAYYVPQTAAPGFAPQGIVGDALGAIGAPLGGFIGGRFGNAGLGQTIGGTVGGLAQRFLPFDAGPQQAYAGTYYVPQTAAPGFAPQGIVGDALGAIGAPLGGFIGGRFGNAGLGQTIGGTVGGLAQRFLPFEAEPVFVPQGFIGDALGAVGGRVGNWIGGRFGNAGAGQTVGNVVGGLAQRFLPFEAGPQAGTYYVPQTAAPVFAPQGIVGDALGAIGAPLGGFIGGRFGNAGLGQTIGGTVGGLAQRFLPFEAEPVFVPQGFIGDALGAVGGRVGNWIGGRFGNAGAGQTVGNVVGGLAQRFLPFEAGPQPVYYVPQMQAPMYG